MKKSKAIWKFWGNSIGMLDMRLDFQNLPKDFELQWTLTGYALMSSDDWSGYRTERNEILNTIRRENITGLVTVVGDRHSFQAGLLSASLATKEFSPVAVEFVTGSVSAPGLFEATEYAMPKEHPLRAIYLYQKTSASPVQPAINLSLIHGVRSALALQQGGDLKQAVEASNPELSPHLSFIDMGGHGYATVRASSEQVEVEFVCIRRPLERSERADGGELSYRVKHRVTKWTERHALKLERTQVEGTLPLLI